MFSSSKELKLIDQAFRGNQKAFQLLYEHHVDALFAFMMQFSDHREEAREWTQRAFIKAFEKLQSYKGNARFKSWLFTIALNEMRTDRRKSIQFVELDTSELHHNPVPDIIKQENMEITRKAIQNLDADKRMVFLLYEAEQYSHREIGEMLHISESTSRVMLHRAKKELQELLQA